MMFDLTQGVTQTNAGGMTEIYLDAGTYVKSFYTVMMQPSSVRVSLMQSTHLRMHHSVKWRHTVPVIVDEKHRRTA